jgi:hypothetical protein
MLVFAEVRVEASPKKLWTFGIFRHASINLRSISGNHHINNARLSEGRKAIGAISAVLSTFVPICKGDSIIHKLLTVERGSCHGNSLLYAYAHL